jgi:hypothetical protein
MKDIRVLAVPVLVAAALAPGSAGAVSALGNFVSHSTDFSFGEADMTFGFDQSTISFALPQAEPGKALKSVKLRVDYSFVGTLEWTTQQSVEIWENTKGEDLYDFSALYADFLNYSYDPAGGTPELVIFENNLLVGFYAVEFCVIDTDPYVYDQECLANSDLSYSWAGSFDDSIGWLEPAFLAGYQGNGTIPVGFGIDWFTNSYLFPDFKLTGTATVVYEYAAPIPLPAGLPLLLAGLAMGAGLLRPWRRVG